jgi:hypothetical protein
VNTKTPNHVCFSLEVQGAFSNTSEKDSTDEEKKKGN